MKQSLRQARIASNYTGQEVADHLGISRSQLYRIETGESQAGPEIARRMREYWPVSKVPDLAIYDPREFARREALAKQGKNA